ncbi:c-type cytochrome [Chelativorans salis]|uniref:Cytochrome c n=1 Tax=Chelativorans salis TaxID=2978478 RepID=A0ABT2LP65_9HYPH|nr:cytochrome c [Chelativorans sp. EGI FJ00035]MCT7374974.1 cytochrome c [Chelativorans sp. EGI FJ00035]
MDKRELRKGSLLVIAGVAGVLVVLAVIGLVVVYTGGYNVAATEQHTSFTRWAFDTTLRNSVRNRASGTTAPEGATPEMIAAGGTEYKATCQHCHAGPGVERAEWASGMRPRPPHLAEVADEWKLEEVHWIAKHGIRLTGMPAFGPSHDDRTLWNIALFVKRLPAMTPEEYAATGEPASEGSSHGENAH